MRRVSTSLFGAGAIFVIASGHYPTRIAIDSLGFLSAASTASVTLAASGGQETAEPAKRADQRVSGKVVDRDGTPVAKAEVRFEGPKRGKVWTNAAGEFSFAGPPGEYAISVKAGERHGDFRAKIADNELQPSTLIIEPKQAV